MILLPVSHWRQSQQSDCLVACAAMVLAYLQLPVNYARLAKLLETLPFGTVFSKLNNLAGLGLHVLIEEGDINKLRSHLDQGLPCIIPIKKIVSLEHNETTNHAIVLVGIDEGTIYINDPELENAPQEIDLDEFLAGWVEQDYTYAVIGLDVITI